MRNTTKRGKPMASSELLSPLDEARKRLNELMEMHMALSKRAYDFHSWVYTLPSGDITLEACAAVLINNLPAHFVWSDPIGNMLAPYKVKDNSTFGEIST